MSKVKVMRQPTASATLIFEFEVAASEFLIKKSYRWRDICFLGKRCNKRAERTDSGADCTTIAVWFLWWRKEQPCPNHPHSNQRKRSGSTMLKW